jgi:hypothetical protein
MKDLLLMLASVMPFQDIVNQLEKEIADYKADPTEENKKMLTITCVLLTSKHSIDNTKGGVVEVMEQIDLLQQGKELLSPKLG